jgi:hypothetical protein
MCYIYVRICDREVKRKKAEMIGRKRKRKSFKYIYIQSAHVPRYQFNKKYYRDKRRICLFDLFFFGKVIKVYGNDIINDIYQNNI